jgi:hypothetical protein
MTESERAARALLERRRERGEEARARILARLDRIAERRRAGGPFRVATMEECVGRLRELGYRLR